MKIIIRLTVSETNASSTVSRMHNGLYYKPEKKYTEKLNTVQRQILRPFHQYTKQLSCAAVQYNSIQLFLQQYTLSTHCKLCPALYLWQINSTDTHRRHGQKNESIRTTLKPITTV